MAAKLGRGKSNIDFTTGPIIKQIVLFSIPTLFGNIFNALYNVVDTIVVGQFVGPGALAAVSCCFAITMVCTSVYAGFGIGSSTLTAQMFGAKQEDRLTATVNTAYIGGFFIGTTMIILGELLAVPMLRLLNTPDSFIHEATLYLRIIFLGCTSQLFYFMGSGILRALGDSKWPTYALMLCAILNIILDLLFVVAFHWSCAGVAAATVISQVISGIAVIIRIYRGNYGIHLSKDTFKIDTTILKMILKIGIPGMIQMLVTSAGTLIIQAFSNSFGENLVATNGIVQKIENFAMMPAMSFGTALSMFVGQNLGASNDERCSEGIKKGSAVIISVGVAVSVVCLIFARLLCRAFVNDETVIQMGIKAVYIMAPFFVCHAVIMSMSNTLQGAAATRPVMYFSFIGIAVRVLTCYLFAVRTGNWQGLFWATNFYNVVTMLFYALYVWKGNWKKYVQVRRR